MFAHENRTEEARSRDATLRVQGRAGYGWWEDHRLEPASTQPIGDTHAAQIALHILADLGEAALVVNGERVVAATAHTPLLLGYTVRELCAFPSALELADPSERAGLEARVAAARDGTPEPTHVEARIVTKSGARIVCDVTITTPGPAGDAVRLIVLRRVEPVARGVDRAVVQRIMAGTTGPAREAMLRSLGREIARSTRDLDIDRSLAAFGHLGMGDLTLTRHESDVYEFAGRDLIERSHSREPCFLALGFLESIVAFAHHGDALGSELACQARDARACVFLVRQRARPPAPRRA